MTPNELLKKWVEDAGISYAEAARRLSYDRGNFHRIVSGETTPKTLALAHAIEEMTAGAVPMAAWVPTPTEAAAAA